MTHEARVKSAKQSLINSRKRAARKVRPFVAIDSEGVSFGEPIVLENGDTAKKQRTVFWGAGNDGAQVWLDGAPYCSSVAIIEFLLSLPEKFGDAIFVWFGSSYDATQIFADLPYDKAWELQHGKPYPLSRDFPELKGSDDATPARMGRYVFWKDYALSYIKQKCLVVGRLADPDNARGSRGQLKFSAKITIFDVFGFFQSSFLKAADGIPGAYLPGERETVVSGKSSRSDFALGDLAAMKTYTTLELKILARMMEQLRLTLGDLDIELERWQGAGSIAGALFKQHKTRAHMWPVKAAELEAAQVWAHRAFFGGRIELLKQGFTDKPLQSYDVRSAYPFHMSMLPSMAGGRWECVENPSWTDLRDASALSMFEVDFEFLVDDGLALNKIYGQDAPEFYPFPYREENGSIVFPPRVRGIYMAEEVRAAFDWMNWFRKHFLTRARNPFAMPCRLELKRAMLFRVADTPELAFPWIPEMYEERRLILAKNARTGDYDMTEKVLKLGYNSGYGKTAQSVGNAGKAPGSACPWFAAAITAGTRAQLLRGALTAPRGAMVAFMTDGIVATKKLKLPLGDGLGQWEHEECDGGLFVQPGVYSLGKKARHRGIKKDLVGAGDMKTWLSENARKGWTNGDEAVDYPYRYYCTLGGAVASEERFDLCGFWVDGRRSLALDNLGRKRAPTIDPAQKVARAVRLIDTKPKPAYFHQRIDEFPLSAMYKPDWLDAAFAAENELENLNEEIDLARGA